MKKDHASTTSGLWPWLPLTIVLIVLVRGALAAFMPMVQDEAYYFAWTRHWDWGYFDHPPMVAYLAAGYACLAPTLFNARLGGVLLSLLMIPVMWRLLRVGGIQDAKQRASILLMINLSILGLIFGVLATPDVGQGAAWLLALHEAAVALRGRPRRWLSAGIATGLGLWAKYTMLLIGPVFLWALWRKKGALKSPWPYLGGVACLVVFLPHLWWNAQNDWISFRFQLQHGLVGDHAIADRASDALPRPVPTLSGSMEERLGNFFREPEEEVKAKKPESAWEKALGRVGDYVGAQVGLWGLLIFPILWGLRRRLRGQVALDHQAWQDTRHLWLAATFFPLVFFLLVSLRAKVEANWAATYIFGAGMLLATWRTWSWRSMLVAGLANVLLATVVIWHATNPFPSRKPHKDRILVETSGYRALADTVSHLNGPLFADSYQLVAEMMFWDPHLIIAQWPGITRQSEFTRRPAFMPYDEASLAAIGQFWLITTRMEPPSLPGFQATRLIEARDCFRDDLRLSEAKLDHVYTPPCSAYVHRWFLVHYQKNKEAS